MAHSASFGRLTFHFLCAISYSPLGDISFELDLEAQEKEPSFSSSAETGSASLEKKSDELRALAPRTIEMKRQEKKTGAVPILFINLDESTDRRQSFEKISPLCLKTYLPVCSCSAFQP